MKVEDAVKLMTHDTAEIYGLLGDRGTLEVGKRADLNVLDYDELGIFAPEMVYDLPTGAPRLMQESYGYKATVVAGEIVRENGEFTGARPGRLVRGRR
jgi:N-acyl-D-aspartate/D-glutamate deacylase